MLPHRQSQIQCILTGFPTESWWWWFDGYYGLTASSLLATGFLSTDEKPATWIVDAIEKRGGFLVNAGLGMTRDTYSPVEVTMIETGENHATLPHLYSCTEQLQLLRTLLLREDRDVLQIGEGIHVHGWRRENM
jgi:hypothetical protein